MSIDITVVVPTIPGRETMLARALASINRQTLAPQAIVVEHDRDRTGAAATRNRAMRRVETEWVAFLDDDDEMLPQHLETLAGPADAGDADYVFADFRVPENPGFRLGSFCYGEFNPGFPLQTTITILVRTALVREFGFVWPPKEFSPLDDTAGEDWWFTWRAAKAGHRIVHVPEVTWLWRHHGANTSGQGVQR